MSKTRKMRLVAFLKTGPTAHHHGMWRHPETDNDFLDPAWYEHVARGLEKGRFDCLFFADTLGIFDNYRGGFDTILRGGGQMGLLDPLPVLAVMSRATQHIGLGATMSTTYHNPYQIARTLGTLDVLSKGRMAWNVVSSISNLEARNFGHDALPPRNTRYDRADEVMEACFKLWESWEPDALIVDKESGVFADPVAFDKRVSLLYLHAGTVSLDAGIHKSAKALYDRLMEAGVKHVVFREAPGLAHEWQTWRDALALHKDEPVGRLGGGRPRQFVSRRAAGGVRGGRGNELP